MTFANPAGLLLLGLVIPVLLLHILKPQRDSVDVSSVYLWQGLAAPVSAARPWQRLRPSLLLLLQLLVVVGLALTVARPVRLTDALVAEHTVFIIDASGSMAAKDGDPDRLASAIKEAKSLRDEVPDGGLASVVVASARSDVLRVLLLDSRVPTGVDAAVKDGFVTLTGGVDRQYQRDAATFVAGNVPGVTGVDNQIHLTGPATGDVDTQEAIRRAFARDARLADDDLVVVAWNGTATLLGPVHSVAERDAAVAAAWTAPGVINVDDRLTVIHDPLLEE